MAESEDSLTTWIVGAVASAILALALAAVRMFTRHTDDAIARMERAQAEHHADVMAAICKVESNLAGVAQRSNEHASQLAVVHTQIGQLQQELKDVRVRQDALATHWQERFEELGK